MAAFRKRASLSVSARPTAPFSLTEKQGQANSFLAGPQRHKGLIGGARSGKTFLLTRATVIRALRAEASRHAILRFRANAVRSSIALDTLPKVVKLCFPGLVLKEHRQDGFFELPNGSQIWLGGLDDKDRVEKILGQEFLTLYFNECSQIPYSSVLVARTRLAQVHPDVAQRAYYDLNPSGTGHWTYHEFIEGRDPQSRAPLSNFDQFGHFYLNPRDNAANLSPEFIASLESLPEKQRKRFLDGRYVAEVDGALWTLDGLEQCRWDAEPLVPGDTRLGRIVVGVDPSGAFAAEEKRSDEIGIVAAGRLHDGTAIVLEDATMRGGPAQWAKQVANVFQKWGADAVVAEINYGGAMVVSTLQTENKSMPVKVVTASRGKHVRAEPVSALYENGQVKHNGRFPDLEDQMTNFSTAGYVGDRSPDRADACLVAGSVVTTRRGSIPIECVVPGDWVLTRWGWHAVSWSGKTRSNAKTFNVQMSNGVVVTATEEHPIFVKDRGFVAVRDVRAGDAIFSEWELACCETQRQQRSFFAEKHTADILTANRNLIGTITRWFRAPDFARCIVTCGKNIAARFQAGGTSITKTAISSTTTYQIWSVCRQAIMLLATKVSGRKKTEGPSIMPGSLLPNGMGRKKAGNGTANKAVDPGLIVNDLSWQNAQVAEKRCHRFSVKCQARETEGIVLENATGQLQTEKNGTRSRLSARSVEWASKLESGESALKHAPVFVEQVSEGKDATVYNLHVDGPHEFFANGVLVHNCVWALSELMLGDHRGPVIVPAGALLRSKRKY